MHSPSHSPRSQPEKDFSLRGATLGRSLADSNFGDPKSRGTKYRLLPVPYFCPERLFLESGELSSYKFTPSRG